MSTRASDIATTTRPSSPTLVNLHAKLLLRDSVLAELRESLEDEAECEWYLVDLDQDLLVRVDSPEQRQDQRPG